MNRKDHTIRHIDPDRQRIWDYVSDVPIANLWNFQGISPMLIARRTLRAFLDDNLLSRAAELGYYFLFALFPTLVSASAILGLAANRASEFYVRLLNYLSIVVPHDALGIVMDTFNQTAANSSKGKITFGLAAAIWSASVGFSAIQDTLNTVYKVKETRPYWKARGSAMLVTLMLSVLVTLTLGCLLVGTMLSHELRHYLAMPRLGLVLGFMIHIVFDVITFGMLVLLFAVIYYFAPDIQHKCWRWMTPGAAIGILGWFLASLALRLYLHYFDSYSLTYGSLGAVIVLLTWFYITGLMLLTGAEINSEIEAAAAEARLKAQGMIAQTASAEAVAAAS